MHIAVDFDGTLCTMAFPGIGKAKAVHKRVAKHILERQKGGDKLILWTCRENIPEGDYLTQAVTWCEQEYGLVFDYINENPDCDFGHPDLVRKIMADYYIDDKAINIEKF